MRNKIKWKLLHLKCNTPSTWCLWLHPFLSFATHDSRPLSSLYQEHRRCPCFGWSASWFWLKLVSSDASRHGSFLSLSGHPVLIIVRLWKDVVFFRILLLLALLQFLCNPFDLFDPLYFEAFILPITIVCVWASKSWDALGSLFKRTLVTVRVLLTLMMNLLT